MIKNIVDSASVTTRSMEKGSYELVVKNYPQCCKGIDHALMSKKFIVGGYDWKVVFYPYGTKHLPRFDSEHASLYIHLVSETTSPIQCLYEFFILDQSGKGHHWGRSLFSNPPSQGVLSITYNQIYGYPQFTKRSLLESCKYLKDDCLKIRATIGVFTSEVRSQPLVKFPVSNIGDDIGKLLESKEGADVLFRVNGESFCAHKCILAARSRVFRSHFSDAHQQHQEIVITDIQPNIFKAMLWFIYTGNLLVEEQVLESFMLKMLAAADRFELKKLKKICESSIIKEVSVESVAYLLHLAWLHHATELKAACLRCIAENHDAVMESDGLLEYLRENCPSLFLDVVGYKGNPFTSMDGESDLGSNFLNILKNSVVSIFCPQPLTVMMHENKDL